MRRIGLILGFMAALAGGFQEIEVEQQGSRQFCRVATTPLTKPASDNAGIKIVKAEEAEGETGEPVVIDLVNYSTN